VGRTIGDVLGRELFESFELTSGNCNRYILHLDCLQRHWVRIDIDHVKGQIPRSVMADVLHAAWSYLRDYSAAICKVYASEHTLNPSDLIIGESPPDNSL
jgi:hypothetical protein